MEDISKKYCAWLNVLVGEVSKMFSFLFANTSHDMTTFKGDGMV